MKLLVALLLLCSCGTIQKTESIALGRTDIDSTTKKLYTHYSQQKNTYQNFHSPTAIQRIADIENEYFSKRAKGEMSRYFGTEWRKQNPEAYVSYAGKMTQKSLPMDSMHCTIYAYESLKAGFSKEQLLKFEKAYYKIWKDREKAGWSVAYLLVRDFNWKAYLVLDETSKEYEHCVRAFKKSKSYPVWRQPDVPLENMYIRGQDDEQITKLLLDNEYSWGFSEQGIHTWVTRFDILKECYWTGAPYVQYKENEPGDRLFLKTAFLDYTDYGSHILVFPPKK